MSPSRSDTRSYRQRKTNPRSSLSHCAAVERSAGNLETGSGAYPRAPANETGVPRRFFPLSPGPFPKNLKTKSLKSDSKTEQEFYSMILSARTSTVGGILRPSALEAFMLIHNSSVVGNSTGKSAALAPLSILSTKYAARWKHQSKLTP